MWLSRLLSPSAVWRCDDCDCGLKAKRRISVCALMLFGPENVFTAAEQPMQLFSVVV